MFLGGNSRQNSLLLFDLTNVARCNCFDNHMFKRIVCYFISVRRAGHLLGVIEFFGKERESSN